MHRAGFLGVYLAREADLKVVKWLSNGYELQIKRRPQDGGTMYCGSTDRMDLYSRCRIKEM